MVVIGWKTIVRFVFEPPTPELVLVVLALALAVVLDTATTALLVVIERTGVTVEEVGREMMEVTDD
jgi:hypothetical protein